MCPQRGFGWGPKERQYRAEELAREAGDVLCEMWNTTRLSPVEYEANMANVVLPADYETATQVVEQMLEEDNIYMLALRDEDSGIVYTRVSAQIYLELSDFEEAGRIFAERSKAIKE